MMKIGPSRTTMAGLRNPVGPIRKRPNPQARQLGEKSHAQSSSNTGTMLSTVSNARMKQITQEVLMLFVMS